MLEAAARQTGAASPEDIVHGVVPHTTAPLISLASDRRAGFRTALSKMIEEAFGPEGEAMIDIPDQFQHREEIEPDDPMALTIACIGCRGYCCHNAEDRNAFLSAETMVLQRTRQPDLTADELLDLYLSYLPTHSQRHSCVYHAERGCTLPRPLRADLCNTWRCPEQKDLLAQLKQFGSDRAAIVAICDDHHVAPEKGAQKATAVSLSPESGVAIHSEFKLPEL